MERDDAHPIQPPPNGTEESHAQQYRTDRLQALRSSYAEHIMELAGVAPQTSIDSEIAAALASIPREQFVGPPPWRIISSAGHTVTVSDDPAVLYQNVLVALDPARGLNNGQPSLHALCLNALAPRKGESAVHVGAGTGYYTAVLAMLVGEAGRIDAYEIEPGLAQRAAGNLAQFSQVAVHGRSGAEAPLPACDLLYVNASAAEPLAVWLDALNPEGRLLFPMAPENELGQMLLVTRKTDGLYAARFLCGVQFISCTGAQDPEAVRTLRAALRKGRWSDVKRLHRNDSPDSSCWCAGRGWWLSTQE